MSPEALPPIIGIVGWHNSGKTRLICGLIADLRQRGYSVAAVKHAHHGFKPGAQAGDSVLHSKAGAWRTAVTGPDCWAIDEQIQSGLPPALPQIVSRLLPCDIVLVEGFKTAAHPKIEVRRAFTQTQTNLAAEDACIFAVVTDENLSENGTVPAFAPDAFSAICDAMLIAAKLAKA